MDQTRFGHGRFGSGMAVTVRQAGHVAACLVPVGFGKAVEVWKVAIRTVWSVKVGRLWSGQVRWGKVGWGEVRSGG